MTDYEQCYEDFWKPILEKGGTLNLDQMKRELFDYHAAMQNVGKVYCHITGSRISKINTLAEVVIGVADEYYSTIYAEPEEPEGAAGELP